jgi:release factor glutamine methyltransferase
LNNEGIKNGTILDIGVGSGVIAVTMACELPELTATAVDISAEALKIAEENANQYEVANRVDFIQSDLFSNLISDKKFDLILSNPPYISEEEYKSLPPEVLADPKIALVSGKEGLDLIKNIIDKAPNFLKPGGRLMFEIGYNQADLVARISEKEIRYKSISIIKDLNDIDRVVILSI